MKTIMAILFAIGIIAAPLASASAHTAPPVLYKPVVIQGHLFVLNTILRWVTVDTDGNVVAWRSQPSLESDGDWPEYSTWNPGQFMIWKNSPLSFTERAIKVTEPGLKLHGVPIE